MNYSFQSRVYFISSSLFYIIRNKLVEWFFQSILSQKIDKCKFMILSILRYICIFFVRRFLEIQGIIRSKYSRHSRFTHSSILNIHIKYYICITLRFFLAFPRLDIFPRNYYRSRYQLRRNASSKILILVQRTSARADGHEKKKKIGERNEGISLTEITRERKRET